MNDKQVCNGIHEARCWVDDRRRIIEGLSDAEIVMWHGMFRCWPPGRMSEVRLKRIEEILARRSLERVVDNSASLARAAATIRAIGKEREGLAA